MNQPQIVIVGRLNSVTVLPDIREKLHALGHETAYYVDSAAFHHAGAALADVDVLVAAPSFVCSRELMVGANRLRGIVSPITGIEGTDLAAATALGIIVTNGQSGDNADNMAEATILMVLAALYDLPGTEAVLRRNLPRPARLRARMLRDKAVGLIGFGQIARAVARRLTGWNVLIQAYARRVPADAPAHVRFLALDDLLRSSDVVCVLATLNAESRGLLNAERLRLMKQDAVLVNTGRGAIIDEAALCRIASQRPDLRLALDTFTTEPLPVDSPLRDLPNAILTPHMLGHTADGETNRVETAIENVRRILAGELPAHVCNPDVIPVWRDHWGTWPNRL